MAKRLRILHLSDLHIGKEHGDDLWRVERVMGEAWERNLAEIRRDGPIDLVCFTGDLAQSGKPAQYADALKLVDAVLHSLDCPRARFFCVPGNHDVDRSIARDVWDKLRELQWHDPQGLSRWMTGGKAPFGCDDAWRDAVIDRQRAYREFLKAVGLPHLLPGQFDNPHPRLGYRRTLELGFGAPLHIIGFDSAWLAGDDGDAGKLRLTDDQIGRLMTGDDGRRLPGWSIGLIHHPLTDLADVRDAQRLLGEYGLGLLLHGHQHDPVIERWSDPQTALPIFAAGCLYEHPRYPNGLLVIDIDLPEAERLRPRQAWARKWSHRRSEWIDDDELYRGTRNGRLRLIAGAPAPTIPTPGKFIGRDDERTALSAALRPAARGEDTAPTVICCAIAGMPGVGKTRLAEEFVAGEWREALGLLPGTPQADLCARLALAPDDRRSAQDIAAAVLSAYGRNATPDRVIDELRMLLRSGPGSCRLLLIENVDGPQQAEAVADLAVQLPGCAVLATARYRDLSDHWRQVSVRPLPLDQAIALLRNRMSQGRKPHPLTDDEAVALVERLGRLPLALHIAGSHLGRGLSPQSFEKALQEKALALGPAGAAGDAARDTEAARRVIASAFAISWELWCGTVDAARQAALVALAHGPAEGVGDALGAAMTALAPADYETSTLDADGLSLLDVEFVEFEGMPRRRVRLHPLIAEFLRLQPGPDEAKVMARIGEWCDPLLRERDSGAMPAAWATLRAEAAALLHWLIRTPQPSSIPGVGLGTVGYALSNGPYAYWLRACIRWSESCEDIRMLGTLQLAESRLAIRIGDLSLSESSAQLAFISFREAGMQREMAIAQGQIADILYDRGEVHESLRIRREEQLPVYEHLGDSHSYATTKCNIAIALVSLGEPKEALRILRDEVLPVLDSLGDFHQRAAALAQIAEILRASGQSEEALHILMEEVLPERARLGDLRGYSITQSRIATILRMRGEYQKVLHIYQCEILPVVRQLGDIRGNAVTQLNIADLLLETGKRGEALRILQEEVLPVFERLGDVRSLAATQGRIADILRLDRDLEGALRISREEILPVVNRLGDAKGRAVTLGRIAAILEARGEQEEALRIRREEELPVYERLGDVRALLVGRTNLALTFARRGRPEDRPEIHNLLQQALTDAERLRLPEAHTIRGLIAQIFGPDTSPPAA